MRKFAKKNPGRLDSCLNIVNNNVIYRFFVNK